MCHSSTLMVYELTICVDMASVSLAMLDDVTKVDIYKHRIITMYTASKFIPSLTLCGLLRHSTDRHNNERPTWASDLARELAEIKRSVGRINALSVKIDALNATVTALNNSVPSITDALADIQQDLRQIMVLSARVCPLVFGQLTV